MSTDVQYWAAWTSDPSVEQLTGDNIEAAARISHVAELRQAREEQQRREDLENLAEEREPFAPTPAEIFERVERQTRAEDYRNDRAEQREREKLLETGGYEPDPTDLRDLKIKSRRDAKGYPRKGSLRWLRDNHVGRPTEPEPAKAPAPPSQVPTPHTRQEWPKWH